MNTTDSAGKRRLGVLATATLIRRFHERCPPGEIYDKAVRCYGTIMETIEKPETARELSALLGIPAVTIKEDAETIINILLFNKENVPYLSFGLKDGASLSEATRRWKSLIVLYHPDRYLNQKIFEDKAKKINDIYAEIQTIQGGKKFSCSFNDISEVRLPKNGHITHRQQFKYIPSIIIALAIITAIFSITVFIFDFISPKPYVSSREVKRKKLTVIQTDRKNGKHINPSDTQDAH